MTTTQVRTALDAARALAPEITARAAEGEVARTMPPDLVGKVEAGGLFGLGSPRVLGGLELDPVSQMEVIKGCRGPTVQRAGPS